MRTSILILATSLALCACASGGPSTHRASFEPFVSQSNLLVRSELATGHYANLYQAVQFMRPRFLSPRGFLQHGPPVVYMDGLRIGDPEHLSTTPTDVVEEVAYINAIDASTRFGPNHPAGVILVTTLGPVLGLGR